MPADRDDIAYRRRWALVRIFPLIAMVGAQQAAFAATFKVTSTADTAGTTCGSVCTLRQAIGAANAAAGADTIAFNIIGTGLQTIAPSTALPTITSPVTIDGYTQSGSSPNTTAVGTNAVLEIELTGAHLSAGASGLTLGATSSPSTIRGLVINRFRNISGSGGNGIRFLDLANAGGAVKGCFIGTNAAGTTASRNDLGGVLLFASYTGVTIGGTALADRNLISGNSGDGIDLLSTDNFVQGNLIGVAADGSSLLGNASGVLSAGNNNTIGGENGVELNVIAGNRETGVLVGGGATGVRIEGNTISANGLLGIDLSSAAVGTSDGVTPNDLGDADTGSNHLQNFPVLTIAELTAGQLSVTGGSLNSTANRTFRIELFTNVGADPSGFGEGQTLVAERNLTTDSGGKVLFNVLVGFAPAVSSRQFITATATDLVTGDTSEFSAGVVVTTPTTVVNTNDSGQGSLRQAILTADTNAGADVIDFAIPGAGVHTIHLLTELPTITDTVTIDGYTQAGASPNALDDGDDAVISIHLDGAGLTAGAAGFGVCAPNSLVKGVSITGFTEGVQFGIGAAGSSCAGGSSAAINSAVEGCYIGVLPDGVTPAPNSNGVHIAGNAMRVGGASSSQRNVISGNSFLGIFVGGGDVTSIDGNYIGTDASGQIARGNGGSGIKLTNSSSRAQVGVQARNRIAYNADIGILVSQSSSLNRIAANDIHDNGNLGIDLGSGGVTPNDLDDADNGPNNLQNFPEIIAVARTATGLSISGTLDRPATPSSLTYAIGVYANSACDPSGFGEGERFLGTFNFLSGDASVETFTNAPLATTAPLPVGTQITLTATDPTGNTSEFSHCAALDPGAQMFVVNSTLDADDGNCAQTIDGCTLREAINAANARAGGDTIAFNIPGGGVHIIAPTAPLPTITDAVTIDGYTQLGALPNSLAEGDNAKILIRIDGLSATGDASGLAICANGTALRGLSVTRFNQQAVEIGINSSGTVCGGGPIRGVHVDGNFVGLAPDGSAAGNNGVGILVSGSVAQVGGSLPSERNIVSANAGGILVNNPSAAGTMIAGNYIGTDPSGTVDRGNLTDGVVIEAAASGVIVGGAAPNRIAFNRNGVQVCTFAKANTFFGNDVFANDVLAIDLVAVSCVPDGPTANDANDGDSGGNDLQNFPVLVSATQEGPNMHLIGSLDVPAGNTSPSYALAFYANATCAAGARGQGEIYLGYANVNLSGSQQEFVLDLPGTAPIGSKVAATATSASGTSEFSTCVTLTGGNLIFADGFE
jgi:CSLREA domain-containing protein